MSWTGRFDRLFIGGDWIKPSGDDRIQVINPATEQVVAAVAAGSVEDADRAVAAAREAFDVGPWPRMSLDERLEVMRRLGGLLSKHQDLIADLVTAEMGCPISLSKTFQAANPRLILEAFIDVAETYPFRSVRRSSTGSALVERVPVGVVAGVVPWNVPLSISMLKIAPALISGCTLILKPASETPLDAYFVAELLQEAGLPDGVFNVLPANRAASEHLVSHPSVDKVSFTGSTATGRRIAAICGGDLRRVSLELGGKSAAIFLDDADLTAAVEKLRFGSLRNSGQVCSLKTRLVVSERREQELLDRLVSLVESMPVGDPLDADTQIGPMVTARHRDVVAGYIELGLAEGARAIVGGRPQTRQERGWYVEPTIFAGVEPSHRIAQEEIFGPVLTVLTYKDEDEAITIANNSDYGLNGAVFTADLERGLAMAGRMRTGTVELNGNPAGLQAPMGGFKSSGIGREQGYEGLDGYTETRSIGLPADLADSLEAADHLAARAAALA
jgi:aldehyde dehydrogenase (NAD+)